MADDFETHHKGLASPAEKAFAITPNNSTNLDVYTRGIYVGVGGDIAIDTVGGSTITFTNLAAGVIHPIRARKVYATGTTATGIIGVS